MQQTVPVTQHNVLDGRSLLHRLKWKEGRRLCLIHCRKLWKSDCGVWWLWGWIKYKGLCASEAKSKVECKQSEHYRGDNIFWEKGWLHVEWGKQAGTDTADHGTNEAERMGYYSSRRRLQRQPSVCLLSDRQALLEETDLLILLLFHTDVSKCTALYFRSDKVKSYVYNIKVLKQVLGEAVCNDLLFLHAFTGCNSVSRVFGIGKKSGFQWIIKREKIMKDCSKTFFQPKQTQEVVETNGSKAMIALLNGDRKDSLALNRYNNLCKKVARAKMFVTSELLPPTISASKISFSADLRPGYGVDGMQWWNGTIWVGMEG